MPILINNDRTSGGSIIKKNVFSLNVYRFQSYVIDSKAFIKSFNAITSFNLSK